MTQLFNGSRPSRQSANHGHSRTNWKSVSSKPSDVLENIHALYWSGVERDLGDILLALREWRKEANLPDLRDVGGHYSESNWTGFGTFVKRATGDAHMYDFMTRGPQLLTCSGRQHDVLDKLREMKSITLVSNSETRKLMRFQIADSILGTRNSLYYYCKVLV